MMIQQCFILRQSGVIPNVQIQRRRSNLQHGGRRCHPPQINTHQGLQPPPEPLTELRTPLTREGSASEAGYWRLKPLADIGAIPDKQVENRVCTPHTWHAAEMFLYLVGKG